MSAIWELGSQPLAERLGWVLIHSIWQGGVVAVIFSLLRLGLRRCSANVRYLTACSALVLLAGAPLATAIYGPIRLTIHSASYAATDSPSTLGSATANRHNSPVGNLEGDSWLWLLEASRVLEKATPLIVSGWILGVVFLSFRWMKGCWWIRRVRTVEVKPMDDHWTAVLEYLKCRFDIRRSVRLVQSSLVDVPMVVGWLKPVILVPASTLVGLSPDQLEAILAHELAHVYRHDYVVNTFQNVVETLLFYHPAVWWISRCIREEREHCCDDLVVRVCEDRLVYARALFRLEELRGAPARFAFAASGGSLLQRVRRLVGGQPEVWPVTVREFSGLSLLAIGCVLLLAGACLMLGTQRYTGTVRIRVERERATLPPPGMGQGTSSFYDPYFIQTEFEVIQSRVILAKVIEELDLNKVWGKRFPNVLKTDETMELLKRQMDIRPVRNTSIIEIQVHDEDPELAARVANTIARVYADYRARKGEKAVGEGIDNLIARLKEQDASVAQARSNVDLLRTQSQAGDSGMTENGPRMSMSAETLRKVESLRLESQSEYFRSKSLLERLQTFKPEELVQAIPTTGIQDSTLNNLVEQKNLVDQRLVSTEKEFGPEYLEVIRLKAQAADLRQKIRERTDGILRGLDARVASLQQSLTDLSNEVAKALQSDVLAANGSQAYFQSKRELEERERFRQMLYLKLASEKTDVQLPRNSMVEILDEAFASPRAYTPNRPRAITLMGCGLLLSILGLILVRSGRNRAVAVASA